MTESTSVSHKGLNGRTILVACDHAAFEFKESLKKMFPQVVWLDCGTMSADRVDYPDYADRLVARLLTEKIPGVLLCGSGQGMALRANRYKNVRAAVVWSEESARLSRAHNDCNIICIGSRLINGELAARMVEIFFTTEFEGGRHADRIAKLDAPLMIV